MIFSSHLETAVRMLIGEEKNVVFWKADFHDLGNVEIGEDIFKMVNTVECMWVCIKESKKVFCHCQHLAHL